MATTISSSSAEVDQIPYDAPLSFPEPSPSWVRTKVRKGANRSRLVVGGTVPNVNLRGKWILISGANNGIGREAALQFAAWGANLVLACRDPPSKEIHPTVVVDECLTRAKHAGVADSEVEWWEVDMAKLKSVEALADRWLATGRPLDILCNNAGIGSSPGGQEIFKTEDGFEIIHQVNFLSHVLLTTRLLPSLAKAPAPRIICTTSCFHYLGKFPIAFFNGPDKATHPKESTGQSGVQLYQNNKLWFQVWLTALHHRMRANPKYSHITVNGVHPGWVNSGIWNVNDPNVGFLAQWAIKLVTWVMGINEQQGSFAILGAAVGKDAGPKVGEKGEVVGNGGRYFNRVWEEEAMPHCRDRDARGRVWRKAAEELGLAEKGLLEGLEKEDGD